jgi:prepilin-type N-terminal cleavage/methylation domain-containing protein
MKNKQKGFTLIELMIVVAIIGILAAIAIPAFLDYMNKGKKTEASLQLDNIDKKIKTFYIEKARMPVAAAIHPAGTACASATGKAAKELPSVWYADPGWNEMKFHVDEDSLFQYRWNGTTLAEAVGDLDCDTTIVTYSLNVTLVEGNVQTDQPEPTAD